MANTVAISRTHLIYGVCLPLAVLLGYLLADPFDSGSVAVTVLVLTVLSVPIFMRWHHALLIFSCNALIYPMFIPGRPTPIMMMASISMLFLVLNRCLGRNVQFFRAPQVSYALIALIAVVMAVAYSTGGIGFAALGATGGGGKRYLMLICGICVYFGLSTSTIPRRYAGLAVAVFFLSALTGLVGYLAAWGGPNFYFLVELFPIESAVNEVSGADPLTSSFTRLGGLSTVAAGIFCFVLARYGMRGILDLTRPWRLALLLATLVANLYSGFRSSIIGCGLVLATVFYLEGLCRTRYFPIIILTAVLAGACTVPYAQKLPLVIQRTLAFLPINLDPVARISAEASTEWRLDMWKQVAPTIPRYLIKGKGYVMDQNDLYLLQQATAGGHAEGYEGAMLAGDYHSGPLSLIIPLGLPGVFAFLWFLWASLKVLRQNYQYGDPELRTINVFLYANFIVRIFMFFFIFGSLAGDAANFAALIGLSVSLNGGVCQKPAEEALPVGAEPEFT